MMSTILWTRIFAFIIVYIHSFSFFVALAAPVPVTYESSSVLRKREPQHGSGLYARQNVHSRDNEISDVLIHSTTHNPTIKSRYALASAGREPQTLVRRNFWSNIGNAFKKVGGAIKSGFQKVGNGIKNAAQKVGNGIKNVAQKVGNGIKNVAKKVGNGIKNVAQKVGNGIKNVAQKVGNGVKKAVNVVGNGLKTAGKWVKANGAKIAKAGLKVLSTVGSVASKVANFIPIPGVNKLLSKGLKFASMGLDKGSNAIKADLGGFGKAMNVMDKIEHPLGGAGGQVLDAVLGRDVDEEPPVLRRDLGVFIKEREFDLFL